MKYPKINPKRILIVDQYGWIINVIASRMFILDIKPKRYATLHDLKRVRISANYLWRTHK